MNLTDFFGTDDSDIKLASPVALTVEELNRTLPNGTIVMLYRGQDFIGRLKHKWESDADGPHNVVVSAGRDYYDVRPDEISQVSGDDMAKHYKKKIIELKEATSFARKTMTDLRREAVAQYQKNAIAHKLTTLKKEIAGYQSQLDEIQAELRGLGWTKKLAKEAKRPVTVASTLPGQYDSEDDVIWGDTGAIDHVLQSRSIEGSETTSIRALTDKERVKGALQLPVQAGTRVSFIANLGSVLAYEDVPDKVAGTVVTVRCADGDVTAYNSRVHVMWDDGKFRPIAAEHLRPIYASHKRTFAVRRHFASLGDLSDLFEPVAKSASDDLVHKATKDLWSFRQEGGEYVIERLFSEDGNPLKV